MHVSKGEEREWSTRYIMRPSTTLGLFDARTEPRLAALLVELANAALVGVGVRRVSDWLSAVA
jgi:hypothetical protein